ncbi:MAG: anti-sigma factor [Candidatus Acidiferrales bacterium]
MNGHPTREEDFDLYVLGALEGAEKQAIETHVSSCADCARKLAEARGRIALLALAAPETAPSPRVKERLMQQVHASSATPAAISARPISRRDFAREGGVLSRWWVAVFVPAFAIAAIAAIFLWTQNAKLNRQIEASHAAIQQQQTELDRARAVVNLVEAHDTIVVKLARQPGAPEGSARVLYNAREGTMLYDGQLAPAPEGKSYQLWLVPANGKPISAGVFNPAAGRITSLTAQVPPGIAPKAFAVTLEPAGGKPQPTGPMVLVGPVS